MNSSTISTRNWPVIESTLNYFKGSWVKTLLSFISVKQMFFLSTLDELYSEPYTDKDKVQRNNIEDLSLTDEEKETLIAYLTGISSANHLYNLDLNINKQQYQTEIEMLTDQCRDLILKGAPSEIKNKLMKYKIISTIDI